MGCISGEAKKECGGQKWQNNFYIIVRRWQICANNHIKSSRLMCINMSYILWEIRINEAIILI